MSLRIRLVLGAKKLYTSGEQYICGLSAKQLAGKLVADLTPSENEIAAALQVRGYLNTEATNIKGTTTCPLDPIGV